MKKKWGLALLASACCLLMSPTGILAAQPTELFTAEETVTSGDNNRTAMWIIFAFIGISGIVVMTGKKKDLVEKK